MEHRKGTGVSKEVTSPVRQRNKPVAAGVTVLLMAAAVVTALFTVFTLTHTEAAPVDKHITNLDFHISGEHPHVKLTPEAYLDVSAARAELLGSFLVEIETLKETVVDMRKNRRLVMPWNPEALKATKRLQDTTRCLLSLKYGNIDRRMIMAMTLQFPDVMLQQNEWLRREHNGNITLLLELAPMRLLPHTTFTILEIARLFEKGNFHRNAGHVLQNQIDCKFRGGLVFMEYDKSYRHEKYTLGFAGRGGGNALYINTENNTMTHGPGTDRGGKDPESDTVFGKILAVEPMLSRGKNIVDVMRKQPGGQKPNGFISDSSLFIKILKFEALLSRTDWPRYGLQYEELTNSLRSAPEDFYYDETIHKRELYREYSLVREVVYADLFPSVEYGRCVPILRQLRKSVVGDRRC